MQLREGEQILKVYHHHPLPFVGQLIKVIIGSFPFFLLIFLFQSILSNKGFLVANLIVFFIFALVVVYVSLIYWLDKLIITSQRIIFVNWKYLTVRDEAEALLDDIQDVRTEERGILATFWIFDYGLMRLETASSSVIINFINAPDPESIRQFIYHVKDV
ncbi:MAG: hypothetical protein ABIH78_03365 [Candidatus Peregrinibacteria bacterium]